MKTLEHFKQHLQSQIDSGKHPERNEARRQLLNDSEELNRIFELSKKYRKHRALCQEIMTELRMSPFIEAISNV